MGPRLYGIWRGPPTSLNPALPTYDDDILFISKTTNDKRKC